MHLSSSLSCALASKSAWNWSRLSPRVDRGAPGQSVLNNGLAISVTRSLFSSRIFRASSSSFASSSVTFLFHVVPNSIQCRPKSPGTIWHSFSKSCVISSLIPASLNGHVLASNSAVSGAISENAPALFTSGGIAASRAAIPKPPSTLRLVYSMCPSSAPLKVIEAFEEPTVCDSALPIVRLVFRPRLYRNRPSSVSPFSPLSGSPFLKMYSARWQAYPRAGEHQPFSMSSCAVLTPGDIRRSLHCSIASLSDVWRPVILPAMKFSTQKLYLLSRQLLPAFGDRALCDIQCLDIRDSSQRKVRAES